MSTENLFIYLVLPALGWIILRIGKIERKLTAICVRCELHLKVKKNTSGTENSSDTDLTFR